MTLLPRPIIEPPPPDTAARIESTLFAIATLLDARRNEARMERERVEAERLSGLNLWWRDGE